MDVGDVIKTSLDNAEHVESVVLMSHRMRENNEKKKIGTA